VLERWEDLTNGKNAKTATETLGKELAKRFKDRSSAPDIALFGRMLAENPELNVDAACQVAHAISTHRVSMEMDFYTAVDELRPEDTAGAGMMGFTGFDSACFYRYARVDWGQLVKNLGGDAALARRTVEGFLRAALEAVPTGKQNGFAAQNPPSLAFAVVRDGGPGWSLANAFEKPVQTRADSGLVQPSVAALDAYWSQLCGMWGSESVQTGALLALGDATLNGLGAHRVATVGEWVARVAGALPQGGEA
jgi:CRISPR system Cascade subunit CasC